MKYSIIPRILLEKEYNLLAIEIHEQTINELNDIIESCNMAMNGKFEELYWGWHVSSLEMRKEITRLLYNDVFIAEIPTVELSEMLKAYRDKLQEYENEQGTKL